LGVSVLIGDECFEVEVFVKESFTTIPGAEDLEQHRGLVYVTGSWYMSEEEGMIILANSIMPIDDEGILLPSPVVSGVGVLTENTVRWEAENSGIGFHYYWDATK
jgi:hypothetical protein